MPHEGMSSAEMPASKIKRMLKAVFHHFGFDIVRHQPTAAPPIDMLGLAVRAALAGRESCFFLQVGANDGIRHDPLHALVREFHLPGLLVEPLPDMFEALRRNYAGEPQLRFENAAVAAQPGTLDLVRFRADAPVDDDLHGLASADIPRMERFARFRGLAAYLERVPVPCVTFEDLLSRHGIDQVDLLVMDVEGHEWELLQAAFRAGLRPGIVFMEFIHLSPQDRLQAEELLARRGYGVAYCGIDLIALRQRDQGKRI